jgi:plastocyanin
MNRRFIYLIVIAVIVVAMIIGFVLFLTNKNQNQNNQPPAPTTGTVLMKDSSFVPDSITITKGNSVTWQNDDQYTHHVVADDGSFDLGDQSNGEKVSYRFNKTGTYNYHCSIHTFMTGKVVVE